MTVIILVDITKRFNGHEITNVYVHKYSSREALFAQRCWVTFNSRKKYSVKLSSNKFDEERNILVVASGIVMAHQCKRFGPAAI